MMISKAKLFRANLWGFVNIILNKKKTFIDIADIHSIKQKDGATILGLFGVLTGFGNHEHCSFFMNQRRIQDGCNHLVCSRYEG